MVFQAMEKLRELQEARKLDVLTEYELAERARAILDRSEMRTLDVTEYLMDKGYEGAPLMRAVGRFGALVKIAYVREYGRPPLRTHIVVNHDVRPVNAYLETDRPLFDRVFEEWSK